MNWQHSYVVALNPSLSRFESFLSASVPAGPNSRVYRCIVLEIFHVPWFQSSKLYTWSQLTGACVLIKNRKDQLSFCLLKSCFLSWAKKSSDSNLTQIYLYFWKMSLAFISMMECLLFCPKSSPLKNTKQYIFSEVLASIVQTSFSLDKCTLKQILLQQINLVKSLKSKR